MVDCNVHTVDRIETTVEARFEQLGDGLSAFTTKEVRFYDKDGKCLFRATAFGDGLIKVVNDRPK